jgi:hypothetical protein
MARKRKSADMGAKDRVRDTKSRMGGSSKGAKTAKGQVPYPTVNEPMLAHPWNNSIVKIRDGGTVDIFTGVDNGIRINPNDKTVDMFSHTSLQHTSFIRSFVKKDEIHKVGGLWSIHCTTARITATGSVDLKAGRNILMTAGGDIKMKAGGKHYFD